jgi:serine palmitoyltransferase
MAVAASEGISELTSTPSLLTTLHENIRTFRLVLDAAAIVCPIEIPSHPASAIIHIQCKTQSPATLSPFVPRRVDKPSNPASLRSNDEPEFDVGLEERLLQEVVEEALSQGVLITKARRLRGQEPIEPRPSIRIALTSALTKKEIEKAASVIRASLVKVLGKRKQ